MFAPGGSTSRPNAISVATASTPPAAPSAWPCSDLVDEIGACARPARASARGSAMSPAGVDVACALT